MRLVVFRGGIGGDAHILWASRDFDPRLSSLPLQQLVRSMRFKAHQYQADAATDTTFDAFYPGRLERFLFRESTEDHYGHHHQRHP